MFCEPFLFFTNAYRCGIKNWLRNLSILCNFQLCVTYLSPLKSNSTLTKGIRRKCCFMTCKSPMQSHCIPSCLWLIQTVSFCAIQIVICYFAIIILCTSFNCCARSQCSIVQISDSITEAIRALPKILWQSKAQRSHVRKHRKLNENEKCLNKCFDRNLIANFMT